MKLTRKLISEMVKDEFYSKLLSEASGGGLYSVPMADLLEFCKEYTSLGTSIQQQIHELLEDPTAMVNPAAVKMVQAKLGGVNAELDELLSKWYTNNA